MGLTSTALASAKEGVIACQDQGPFETQLKGIKQLTEGADKLVTELHELSRRLRRGAGVDEHSRPSVEWIRWIRSLKKIERLKTALRDTRLNLNLAIQNLNIIVTSSGHSSMYVIDVPAEKALVVCSQH